MIEFLISPLLLISDFRVLGEDLVDGFLKGLDS